jgi:hypothetical protein
MSEEPVQRRTIPTIVSGDDEEPFVLDEIIDAALTREQHRALSASGLTVLDVLAGRFPSLIQSRSSSEFGTSTCWSNTRMSTPGRWASCRTCWRSTKRRSSSAVSQFV